MTAKAPLVSVVMSVYNGAPYLKEAVDSILAQTFTDFEFIIINDGSTDGSGNILGSYADQRIKLTTQPNRGLVASLNRGIEEACGKYIARQDADDASHPGRLEKQITFLEQHPQTVLLGSSMSVMDALGKTLHKHAVLLHDAELKQELLVRSPFAHGSVVFERQAAIECGLYRQEYWPAEDYDLWLRLADYGAFANIDDCLYAYREHGSGISATNQALQTEMISRVQADAWRHRHSLIGRRKIRLGQYRNLEHGVRRAERILTNIARVSRAASHRRDLKFALKNASLVASSPLAYRKTAGIIRRRIL